MGSNQYTVNLSDRQRFVLYVFLFIRQGAHPKNREESQALRGVCEAFDIYAIRDRQDALTVEESAKTTDREFSDSTKAYKTGSTDLNKLLAYLDNLERAETMLSDRLLDVSEELLRAKEGRVLAAVEGEVE